MRSKLFKGLTISTGIGVGKAWKIIEDEENHITPRSISETEIPKELDRFKRALELSREQLVNIKAAVEEKIGPKEANIFLAHILLLEDPHLISEVTEALIRKKVNVESIIIEVIKKFTVMFSMLEDRFMRERSADIRDVGRRILKNLLEESDPLPPDENLIIVARHLVPSVTVKLSDKIMGFAAETGEMTSHASILARSLSIPAIVNLENFFDTVKTGDTLILDGTTGTVYLNPTEKIVEQYLKLKKQYELQLNDIRSICQKPSETRCGTRISIMANVGKISDVEAAKDYCADGIGLFRTEFPFMMKDEWPSEEEQYQFYSRVVQAMNGKPVTIRTFDFGGDKQPAYLGIAKEANPQLGWRGIRISLEEREAFLAQLRAILRASACGNVRILFPMISGLEQYQEAVELVMKAKNDLVSRGLEFDEKIPLGVMIEVPSAVVMFEAFLKNCDFVSIGTNDLIQYILAVDRNNSRVAQYYEPLHPSILWTLKRLFDLARKHRCPVSLCGEMAGDSIFTILLLGLGLREFSVNPPAIPVVKKIARSITIDECQMLAGEVLKLSKTSEVKAFVKETIFPLIERYLKSHTMFASEN